MALALAVSAGFLLVWPLALQAHVIAPPGAPAPEAAAATPWTGPVVSVGAGFRQAEVHQTAEVWTDPSGSLELPQVLAQEQSQGIRFSPAPAQQPVHNLRGEQRLWYKFALRFEPSAADDVYLQVPLPYVDRVRFHVRKPNGSWSVRSAGELVPVAEWSEVARYPILAIHPTPGSTVPVYVSIEQGTRSPLPLWLHGEMQFHGEERLDLVWIGMLIGGLALLLLVCLMQSAATQDKDYLVFGAYTALMLASCALYCGVMPMFFPWKSELWVDRTQVSAAVWTAGMGMYVVRMILLNAATAPWLLRTLFWGAVASAPLGLISLVFSRSVAASSMGVFIAAAVGMCMVAGVIAQRQRNQAALWLIASFVPTAVAVAAGLGRMLSASVPLWLTNYGLAIAAVISLPLSLVALGVRSRDRHVATARAKALETQDPLTGLIVGPIFRDRLERACKRYEVSRANAAVIMFHIANFEHLRQHLPPQALDKLLLRAVIRIRRVLHESDNLSRLDMARFAVILEGDTQRAAVQELCAKLIASGLMQGSGAHGDLPLHFQCVAVIFSERFGSATSVTQLMAEQLAKMSSRSRRPIRFLDQQPSGPESVLPPEPPAQAHSQRPTAHGWEADTQEQPMEPSSWPADEWADGKAAEPKAAARGGSKGKLARAYAETRQQSSFDGS